MIGCGTRAEWLREIVPFVLKPSKSNSKQTYQPVLL